MKIHLSGWLLALTMGLTLAISATPSAQGQTFTVLHTFSGSDGSGPDGTLVMDGAGNLYGNTYFGGANDNGAVFKLTPSGDETVLFSGGAAGNSYGAYPEYGVILDKAGNMFGLLSASPKGGGEIVERNAAGKGKILYDFGGCTTCFRPRVPSGGLLEDTSGNLYGVTALGGIKGKGIECETYGCGTAYKLDTTGALQVLHAFTGGADGRSPQGALIPDAAGNLYGATISGGDLSCPQGLYTTGCGVVFKLAPDGAFTVLHTFSGLSDGASARGALVMDNAGNLYGAAQAGGNPNCNSGYGCGTLFKIAANGKFSVLYTFTDSADSSEPNGNLVMDAAGNLYGDAQGDYGNVAPYGSVFELSAAGKFIVLHILNGNTDGADPTFGLIRDSAGNLYGSAYQGFGFYDRDGTVFEVTP